MTLHITQTMVGQMVHVNLAGHLTGEEVHHLLRTHALDSRPWVLDLGDLLAADEAGVSALHELEASGVELLHAKPYVAMLLRQNSGENLNEEELLE